MKFRDYILEQQIKDFYNNELKEIEKRISISEASSRGSMELWNIRPLFEAVIEPHLIKIRTNNINKLNDEFKKFNIKFSYSDNPNDLRGYYDKENDEINIFFNKNIDFETLEAMIGHEMVHKEQHKRAGENYFKQSEQVVTKINHIAKEMSTLNIFDLEDSKKFEKLKKERQELLNKFLYLSPYETMAYAYQFVKEYKSLSPSGIINKLKENGILINNLTKKYIAMYWLIRNKI